MAIMFGFPTKEHKQFKKNFLKSVIFQLSYNKCDLIGDKSDKIENLFKTEYPRFTSSKAKEIEISFIGASDKGANFQQSDKGDVIQMRSLDGQKIINITEEALTLTVSGAVYKNFDKIINDLTNIISGLKICGINFVNKLAIRKINIIEFKIVEKQMPIDVLGMLLNPNLIGNINFFPEKKSVVNNMQTLNYNVEDKNLNLKYGLNVPKGNVIGQVIIDIDIILKKQIEIESVIQEANNVNSEVFNIFNWVLSEEAITILDN